MKRNEVYNCPDCAAFYTVSLLDASLLVCQSCGAIVSQTGNFREKIKPSPVPEDWSFLQIGATGEYQKASFKIIGRYRLQLRNDYKNFWCAEYEHGKCLWIVESFGSFSVFNSPWLDYLKDVSKLRAGHTIEISSDLKLKGEYVEKCEEISYQGQLGPWTLLTRGFFLIQASHNNGKTALFFIDANRKATYILGEKIPVEKLNLKNTIQWNEWK